MQLRQPHGLNLVQLGQGHSGALGIRMLLTSSATITPRGRVWVGENSYSILSSVVSLATKEGPSRIQPDKYKKLWDGEGVTE